MQKMGVQMTMLMWLLFSFSSSLLVILSFAFCFFSSHPHFSFTCWGFVALSFSPNHLILSSECSLHSVKPSSLLYPLVFLSFSLFPFYFQTLTFLASSPLHLSCGPNSPITAGRNYAWKLIRHSLNNYPLMQLIDFPFQELCFLSPGPAFLSPR